MSSGDWEALQEDILNRLKIGQKNGETLIDVVTRIVWLERHRNQIRIVALNEILNNVNGDPVKKRRAPMKAIDLGEWRKSAIK